MRRGLEGGVARVKESAGRAVDVEEGSAVGAVGGWRKVGPRDVAGAAVDDEAWVDGGGLGGVGRVEGLHVDGMWGSVGGALISNVGGLVVGRRGDWVVA